MSTTNLVATGQIQVDPLVPDSFSVLPLGCQLSLELPPLLISHRQVGVLCTFQALPLMAPQRQIDMDLHEGAIIDVIVMSVQQFGVLVKFEDKEGVILETNIYWDSHDVHERMRESFKPGQEVRVKVLVVAPKQFSCSIKHLHPEQDPWWDPSIYVVGAVHAAFVKLVFDFGAALFRLRNGAVVFVESVKPGTKVDDEVSVMLTKVDVEGHEIEGRQV